MKKSVIFLLVTILVLMAALPGVTMAAGNGNGNAYGCCGDCGGASAKEYKQLCKMVNKANKRIDKLIAYAQSTPQNDIDWLLDEVEATVRHVFEYAESIGATVVCELVGYYIDGQYVLVDPLRVVSI